MNASDPSVLVERRGEALWITLNRPDRRNAINGAILAGVRKAYEAAHADPEVRAIVLTGSGDRAFCAGADLSEPSFAADHSQPTTPYADLLRLMRRSTLPSIAVVNGSCMAGGMGLVAVADLAIAVDHATFGLPEVHVGVFPMQVLSLLRDLVPARTLTQWCLTGRPFDAAAALRSGLINEVLPAENLIPRALELATAISRVSPTALRRGKYFMREMANMTFDQCLSYAEGQITLLAMSEDAKEGFDAFNNKRRPVFSGR